MRRSTPNSSSDTSPCSTAKRMLKFLANPNYAPWIGLTLRLALAWALPYFLDDGRLLSGVSYTDIDYIVFTDAAQYLRSGLSPYDRHTYRYTPFLAALLAALPGKEAGRYLFCVADALCGWMILVLRRSQRLQQQEDRKKNGEGLWVQLADTLWWTYNPLAINICTRGSAESLMVLLPVLMTFWIATIHERQLHNAPQKGGSNENGATIWQALWTGIFHGVAIHAKLYPIIYSLSYMAYFATPPRMATVNGNTTSRKTHAFPWTSPLILFRLATLWFHRLFLVPPFLPLVFLFTALATFAGLTWAAVDIYGEIALQEGLLYHFSRVDHRHNYSMYWYWIYLARARTTDAATAAISSLPSDVATTAGAGISSLATMGRLLLLPQAFLLAYSSLGLAPNPKQLGLALFVQTYLFVTHNKVITAQYFTWYLCLLPLCTGNMDLQNVRNRDRLLWAIALLVISILVWLGSAYCLEMQGMAVHRWVWMASVQYFFANVNLLGSILRSIRPLPASKITTTTNSAAMATTIPSSSSKRSDAGVNDDRKSK